MNSTLPPGAPPAKSRRAQGVQSIRPLNRLRPIVPLLDKVKFDLHRAWMRGVPEKDLAKDFQLRREEVELVLHEMAWRTGRIAA
jgi:hypothetical protein